MRYSIQDFIQLIAQLRNPNGGCPWDLKQNYESMIPCLTEETYEVIEAIEKKDIPNLREELGIYCYKSFSSASLLQKINTLLLTMYCKMLLKNCAPSSSRVW